LRERLRRRGHQAEQRAGDGRGAPDFAVHKRSSTVAPILLTDLR
jgi:hypothetical protein